MSKETRAATSSVFGEDDMLPLQGSRRTEQALGEFAPFEQQFAQSFLDVAILDDQLFAFVGGEECSLAPSSISPSVTSCL